MKARKRLPSTYELCGQLDISKNRAALLGLSAASLGAFFLLGWLALRLVPLIRPELTSIEVRVGLGELVNVIALLIIVVLTHEAIHGLCFWLYTRELPSFGFNGLYAYAAAPDWYLPRNQHMAVALAPLCVITLAGLASLLMLPAWALPALLFALVLNAAGAIGDLAVAAWLLRQPDTTLVHDSGHAVAIFQPT